MRHVICHYHTYKNSGTTFDAILAANYGNRHVTFDGPFPYFSIDHQELAKVIQRHPRAIAFSSHQIYLPVPCSLDFNVIPVVFVRHPLLRIHSIYRFKRAEDDGTETSRNALAMDFDAWCRHALNHAPQLNQVSNAQVRLFGRSHGHNPPGRRTREGMVQDIHQARRNLRNVDLLARTEHFERDVSRFPALLARYGIEFEVGDATPRNVTASDLGKSIEERLAAMARELAPETLAALEAANRQDLELYAEVSARLDAEPVPAAPEAPVGDGTGQDQPEAAGAEGLISDSETSAEPSNASSRSS